MTFGAREESRSDGAPVTFYLFRYGPEDTSIYAYADAERAIPIAVPGIEDPVTFEPVPIARGDFEATGRLDRGKLEVRLDDQLDLCVLFSDYPPSDVVTVSIYEGHLEEAQVVGVWFGRVIGFGSDNNAARLTCKSVASSLKRPGLRRHYQYGCPHVLYGPACRANQAAATVARTAVTASGGVLILSPGWEASLRTPDDYVGGLVRWTRNDGRTERRTIIAAEATQLTLGGAALGLTGGMSVDISLGCRHTMDDCRELHDNILNYGGQPWIPLKNPIGLTNNFY